MANTVRILVTAKDEISGQLDKIRDKAALLSKTDIGKGMAMGAGIAAFNVMKGAAIGALEAVADFGVGSIKAASDSREAMALTRQVFEGNTKAIEDWSRNSKDAFSSTEALTFASQFGTAFKNVGMTLDETSAKAKEMTTLAGDLGSAFNTSSEEAATALKAGLLGESEPLRRFGVFLDEAKVKAKAAAMGIATLGSTLTDGQKVAARYALIMEQTADSQGMFGRDTESLADKQKLLATNIADLQTKIGTGLIQPLGELVDVADDAVESIDKLATAMDGLDGSLPTGWLDDIVNDLGPGSNIFSTFNDLFDLIGSVPDKFRMAFDFDNFQKESLVAFRASERLEASYEGLTGTARAAGRGIDSAAGAAKAGAPRVNKMVEPVLDLAGAYKDLDKWAAAAAETLLANDPKQLQLAYEGSTLALQDEKAELKDVQAEIEKRHKKGLKATREQRIDENRLKQSIEDTKDETVALGLKLVATGKMSYADLREQLRKLGIVLDHDADEAARLKANLWKAADAAAAYDSLGRGERGKYGNRAIGGSIAPYGTSWVGEDGPELIKVGGAGAMVYASPGSVPSMPAAPPAPVTIGPFYFQGIGSDVTVAAANRFGQATLDVIASGLREQRARLGAA